MRVILVASAKEGSGKTTTATTLASALSEAGRKVAIADADPRRSSLSWLARRPASAPKILGLDCTPEPPRMGDAGRHYARLMRKPSWWRQTWNKARAEARRQRIEWLILDAPSGALAQNSGLRSLSSKADLVVAPVAPALLDESAVDSFLSNLEAARTVKGDPSNLYVIANRLRRKRRLEGRLADAVGRFFLRLGRRPIAEIHEGAVYPALSEGGLGVFDPQVGALTPRKAEQFRAEWRPLLGAMGLQSDQKTT